MKPQEHCPVDVYYEPDGHNGYVLVAPYGGTFFIMDGHVVFVPDEAEETS